MSSYTITITPDDQSHAVSTVRVEVSPTGTRITELVVRAGGAEGLMPHQLPPVDLELLIRAVNPPTRPAVSVSTPPVPGAVPAAAFSGAAETVAPQAKAPRARTAPATVAPFTVPAAAPAPVVKPAVAPAPVVAPVSGTALPAGAPASKVDATTAAPSRGGAARPARAAAPAEAKTPTRRQPARKARTVATPAGAKTAKRAKAGAVTADSGRSYRRAPGDLAEVYRQARSAAGIADHYSVPRHTANNWIRTLKKNNPET